LFIESIYAWLYVILDITICDLKLDVTVCDVWFRVVVQLLCVPVPTGFGTPPGQTASGGVETVIIVFLCSGHT